MVDSLCSQVRLRGVIDSDVPVFFRHQRDGRATTMAGVPAQDREDLLAHWSRIRADETVFTRTITVGDAVAGNVVSWLEDGHREIGYWVDAQLWGRGIASRGVALFVAEVEERPLYAHVVADNAGSIRVLEKVGFGLVERSPTAHDGRTECLYVLR